MEGWKKLLLAAAGAAGQDAKLKEAQETELFLQAPAASCTTSYEKRQTSSQSLKGFRAVSKRNKSSSPRVADADGEEKAASQVPKHTAMLTPCPGEEGEEADPRRRAGTGSFLHLSESFGA